MAITAIRGGKLLSDEIELQAHLATLLRLENLGVLLSAGASTCAGGKTMFGLWDNFVEEYRSSAEWLREHNFIQDAALKPKVERVYPNVEKLVDTLEISLSERRRINDKKVPELEAARASLFRSVIKAALLEEKWWSSNKGAEEDDTQLEHHRTILQKLVCARQPGQASPWIFTTNYDLAIEWAAESIDLQVVNGFIGTHSRRFSPQSFDVGFRNTQARGEARFGVYNIYLAKLHGSLTWQEENNQVFEVTAPLAWNQIKSFIDDKSKTDLGFMVLPRAAKYMQTIGFVLGELFRRFSEFLSKPQTCLLISGYGFGDEHINRMLRSALLNPTLQLVIYYPEFKGDVTGNDLPESLKKILSLKNPRVTVVGGGEEAYLNKLASHLPDPLLYDQDLLRFKKILNDENKVDLDETGASA